MQAAQHAEIERLLGEIGRLKSLRASLRADKGRGQPNFGPCYDHRLPGYDRSHGLKPGVSRGWVQRIRDTERSAVASRTPIEGYLSTGGRSCLPGDTIEVHASSSKYRQVRLQVFRECSEDPCRLTAPTSANALLCFPRTPGQGA